VSFGPWSREVRMPTAGEAPPGRGALAYDVPERHAVLGRPLVGPWPEGLEVGEFALGCFWGAERRFWQLVGVWTTVTGFQGGFTPYPVDDEVRTGLTGHAETDDVERSVAEFRASLEPLERAGKLRGILLQHHPRVKKSPEAMEHIAQVGSLLRPLVPLVEFRHASWMLEGEREDTLAFLESYGLMYVSVDSPRTRATNVLPPIAAATGPVAYVRFHGRNWKTWNKKTKTSGERFDWLYSPEDLEEWVGSIASLAGEAREVA